MSEYKHQLHVDRSEVGLRLQLALGLLASGEAVVVIDDLLALRPDSQGIICEVTLRSSAEPQAEIENAKRLLSESSVGQALRQMNFRWLGLVDYGTARVEVWHEH